MRLRGSVCNIGVLAVYAPALDVGVAAKDAFYMDAQRTINQTHRSGLLIIAGDSNAPPGPLDNTTPHTLVGDTCANGDQLLTWPASLV